jgi:YVTN family beta-propeller protein
MGVGQIKSLILVIQFAVFAAVGSAYAAMGNVYVADEGANAVSVIDATSFTRTGGIPGGQGPHNVTSTQTKPGTTVIVTDAMPS